MNNEFLVNIEKTVLSSIIFDMSNMDSIISKLKPNDLYVPQHQIIYATMIKLYEDGMPIDEDFILSKSLKPINQDVLLNILATNPITNVISYVDEIKSFSIKRQAYTLACELQRITNTDASNDDIFDFINNKQEQIRLDGPTTIKKYSITEVQEKEPEFYLKNWLPIPHNVLTMISAPGGTGKTWLVVQMAIRFIIENPDKKIFLWLSEDDISIVKNRMNTVCSKILDTKLSDKFKNIEITDTIPQPLMVQEKGILKMGSSFRQLRAELKSYDLVVLDPLTAFYGGDENSNSQARLFMQPFMQWAKEDKKAIAFLHHSAKSTDIFNKSRGAGAFIDACRVAYEMNKKYKKDNKTIDNEKLHLRDIQLTKDNYGAIKHFKNFTNERHITPMDTSKDFVEYEFIDIL